MNTFNVDCSSKDFEAIDVALEDARENGSAALRVSKLPERYGDFDADTFARALQVTDFHNGTIDVDMYGSLLEDAPDYARGFIGIVFRVDERNAEFESFYIRPTNGCCTDPVRRSHGCQYFSYPGYTFAYFRRHGIDGYEAPIESGLDEWVHLHAEIDDDKARFYLNGAATPALTIDGLKHGANAHGGIGLYVDDGTDALFRNLVVVCTD